MTLHAVKTEPQDMMALAAGMELRSVGPMDVLALAPYVKPTLERGEGQFRGRSTVDDLFQRCVRAEAQLWLVGHDLSNLRGAIVTELIRYPLALACRYVLLAGNDLDAWIEADEVISAWAKEAGCKKMEALGRPGWKKYAKGCGWEAKSVFFEKDL